MGYEVSNMKSPSSSSPLLAQLPPPSSHLPTGTPQLQARLSSSSSKLLGEATANLKPAWDKLMAEFDGHASALVGDVDCTAAGKPLCDSNGVRGFPTIKYGDPNNLEDYKGGRDFDALSQFAKENLKPVCSPSNIDICDATQKAEIEK